MSDYKKREFVRWKKKYGKYDLQNINDGEFWKTILDLEDKGERIFSEARSMESKNIAKSCEMLQESTIKYDEIFILIEKKEIDFKGKISVSQGYFGEWYYWFFDRCSGEYSSNISMGDCYEEVFLEMSLNLLFIIIAFFFPYTNLP